MSRRRKEGSTARIVVTEYGGEVCVGLIPPKSRKHKELFPLITAPAAPLEHREKFEFRRKIMEAAEKMAAARRQWEQVLLKAVLDRNEQVEEQAKRSLLVVANNSDFIFFSLLKQGYGLWAKLEDAVDGYVFALKRESSERQPHI